MAYKYAFQDYNKESMARGCRRNVKISLKKSVELARVLRGMKVECAEKYLGDIIRLKRPVPYKRYFQEMAHQRGKGVATGGFPVKAAKEFLRLLKSVVKNASEKNLGKDLKIISVSVRKGVRMWKPGRYLGRRSKSTHIEMVVGVVKK